MIFSILATIRAFAAPDHVISCSAALWRDCIHEIERRGTGRRESGAFLLGVERVVRGRSRREVRQFVCYDDLDPRSLDTGIIDFDGAGYTPLWDLCRKTGLKVVADVHTHPERARQSNTDRRNPMIAVRGHVALIVPDFAQRVPSPASLGMYEYRGAHQWTDYTGPLLGRRFYTGAWA
jgi:proteasome lid subunit RPN8/RPN11